VDIKGRVGGTRLSRAGKARCEMSLGNATRLGSRVTVEMRVKIVGTMAGFLLAPHIIAKYGGRCIEGRTKKSK